MRLFVKGFLPWIALGGWILPLAWACYFSPTTADPGRGYTYPINNHGVIHYVAPFVYYAVFAYVPVLAIVASLVQRQGQRSS